MVSKSSNKRRRYASSGSSTITVTQRLTKQTNSTQKPPFATEQDATMATIQQTLEAIIERLGAIDNRFDAIENRFNARFDAIENRFNARFDAIENRFHAIDQRFDSIDQRLDSLDGRKGCKSSAELTVALCLHRNDEPSFTLGHGIVVKAGNENFILTASHVVLGVFDHIFLGSSDESSDESYDESYDESSDDSTKYRYKLQIKFLSGGEMISCSDLKAFIQTKYIVSGIGDVGAIRVSFESKHELTERQLQIDDRHSFDTKFFGKTSQIMLRAHAFEILDEGRVGLSTPSRPGCSGAPLFSDSGKLLALLHGVSKHRGRFSHSASQRAIGEETGTASDDDLSSFVYVDRVQASDHLEFWDEKYMKCLVHLENLDKKEIEDPTRKLNYNLKNKKEEGFASDQAKKFYGKALKLLYKDKKADKNPCFKITKVCKDLVEHRASCKSEESCNYSYQILDEALASNDLTVRTLTTLEAQRSGDDDADSQVTFGDDLANGIFDPSSLPNFLGSKGMLTNVAIKMLDGSHKVVNITMAATIRELAAKIVSTSDPKISVRFQLLAGTPPRALTNWNQTIQESNLNDATLVLKNA